MRFNLLSVELCIPLGVIGGPFHKLERRREPWMQVNFLVKVMSRVFWWCLFPQYFPQAGNQSKQEVPSAGVNSGQISQVLWSDEPAGNPGRWQLTEPEFSIEFQSGSTLAGQDLRLEKCVTGC